MVDVTVAFKTPEGRQEAMVVSNCPSVEEVIRLFTAMGAIDVEAREATQFEIDNSIRVDDE